MAILYYGRCLVCACIKIHVHNYGNVTDIIVKKMNHYYLPSLSLIINDNHFSFMVIFLVSNCYQDIYHQSLQSLCVP